MPAGAFPPPATCSCPRLHRTTGRSRWTVKSAPRSEVYGWANQFDVDQAGDGSLTYETPITRRLLLVGQIVLWLVAFVAWRRVRGVRRREGRA